MPHRNFHAKTCMLTAPTGKQNNSISWFKCSLFFLLLCVCVCKGGGGAKDLLWLKYVLICKITSNAILSLSLSLSLSPPPSSLPLSVSPTLSICFFSALILLCLVSLLSLCFYFQLDMRQRFRGRKGYWPKKKQSICIILFVCRDIIQTNIMSVSCSFEFHCGLPVWGCLYARTSMFVVLWGKG